MSAMTMSAALVAGKVSVTSKCVRGTGRVACDARASIRHPRASRFSHPPSSHDADIPASVARRRVARASRPGADRVPSSPPLPNPQVHPQGAVFQVQVRRASSSLVSGERSRACSPPLRDATFATSTDFRRGIRRTSRGASRDATDAHLDAFAVESPRRATVRVVRGRAGGPTRRPLPALVRPERVPSASANKTTKESIFSEASDFRRLRDANERRRLLERVTDLQTPFISRPLS